VGWLNLWRKSKPPRPPAPIGVTAAEFAEAQSRYIEKYHKYVAPEHSHAVELLKCATEYGKVTLTYLILGNSAGIAAVLAVYPFLRDSNRLWLSQQMDVAIAFAAGLFLSVLASALSYALFLSGAALRWAIADLNEMWIQGPAFRIDNAWMQVALADQWKRRQRVDRIATVAGAALVLAAALSGGCWSVGAYILARNVMLGAALF
jgi:hypothetical protein